MFQPYQAISTTKTPLARNKVDGRCTVAPRFKLDHLDNKTLRYEVIYKNLLRDMRKFYIAEFNMVTDFQNRKKKSSPDFYMECVNCYV
jgi:hypothetical protein